jgi:hypothetical protein
VRGGAPAADDDSISISWDKRDEAWNGMVLTNVGEKPIEIHSVVFNSQERCILQPFTIADLSTGFDSLGPDLKNIIILQLTFGSYNTGLVFIDPKVVSQYAQAKTRPVVLQVGERIGATADRTFPCRSIIRANVITSGGDIRIDFGNHPFNMP